MRQPAVPRPVVPRGVRRRGRRVSEVVLRRMSRAVHAVLLVRQARRRPSDGRVLGRPLRSAVAPLPVRGARQPREPRAGLGLRVLRAEPPRPRDGRDRRDHEGRRLTSRGGGRAARGGRSARGRHLHDPPRRPHAVARPVARLEHDRSAVRRPRRGRGALLGHVFTGDGRRARSERRDRGVPAPRTRARGGRGARPGRGRAPGPVAPGPAARAGAAELLQGVRTDGPRVLRHERLRLAGCAAIKSVPLRAACTSRRKFGEI